ncbi:50S ribosomal protein L17 [Flavobacterium sp. CS20]|uniref:50S ribosomal protein L17 n=1 Tax=Flavobacterium sp. CS20 TaxID=2775246 RepID=UPI001B3A1879|nr:50S ribosomal protein L17 [Flavobacterium sp. CS20]QTY27334.1 50S ribosomal protein L17 [Flavobacterium sp. CS20]
MRHGKKFNHLSRKTAHRKSMLANMACSLIEHKRINTTLAKAKALRTFVEPLVTKSKTDTTHNRRIVFSKIRDKYAVAELFREVAPKVASRPGGYTRIIKLGHRLGDLAEMAMIELVDFNEIYNPKGKKKKKSTRRAGKKVTSDQPETNVESSPKEDSKTKEDNNKVEDKTEAKPEKSEAKAESNKSEAKEKSSDENKQSKDDEKK